MGRKAGRRKYTDQERLDIANNICELYKAGNDIASCCNASGISYGSFYKWIAKYPEVKKAYDATLSDLNETKYDILRSLAESAIIQNLQRSSSVEIIEIEEPVRIKNDDGTFETKMQIKTIKRTKVIPPSVTAALKVYDRLDKRFAKDEDSEDLHQNASMIAERMARREIILEEKLRQMKERDANK